MRHESTGVYKLASQNCNKMYVGMMNRCFEITYKENDNDFIYNKDNSNYANHLKIIDHHLTKIEDTL